MATDYERLKKEGYTEEEIQLILQDPLSHVSLSDAPMGPGRQDKSATITSTFIQFPPQKFYFINHQINYQNILE